MTGNLQLCSICGFFSEVRNNEVGWSRLEFNVEFRTNGFFCKEKGLASFCCWRRQ